MKIGYIVHDLNDAAVRRRLAMFAAGGASVTLAGFRRGPIAPAIAALDPVDLGQTADAALGQRAVAVLRSALFAQPLRQATRACDVLVARNLESLAIARRIAAGRPVVYECLDIHRSLLGTRPMHRAVQRIESALLRGVALILTSSPAFIREYFARKPGLDAPIELIENKLLCVDAPPPVPALAPAGPPWVIGWFGMLRCRRTLAELGALAAAAGGGIRVLIAGKPSPAEFPDFDRQVAAMPHLEFVGAYAPEDLPGLYGQCHFAWTIDWFEAGMNSAWLLPNRLYEASAFGVPPIVLDGVEVGRWLAGVDAGLRVSDANELGGRLAALDTAGYGVQRQRIAAIPAARLIADRNDCVALVRKIGERAA